MSGAKKLCPLFFKQQFTPTESKEMQAAKQLTIDAPQKMTYRVGMIN
jgi:hypothetical protein